MDSRLIADKLPRHIAVALIFQTLRDRIIIKVKPNRPLSPEDFSKLESVVRQLGGSHVQVGTNSHFEIPMQMRNWLI